MYANADSADEPAGATADASETSGAEDDAIDAEFEVKE